MKEPDVYEEIVARLRDSRLDLKSAQEQVKFRKLEIEALEDCLKCKHDWDLIFSEPGHRSVFSCKKCGYRGIV